jgi:nucleotide-binding universal stress UspA family protein
MKKRILGSVAEEIYRLATIPVLTVGPRSTLRGPAKLRILYATDFSPESLHALPYAVSFAQEFGGLLTVLHVATGAPPESDMRMKLGEFLTEELHALLPPEHLPWAKVDYQVKFGPAVEGILEAAQAHSAGVIVMGVRGTGSLQSATPRFGSTAQWVVSLANAPVLTVRGKIFTKERLQQQHLKCVKATWNLSSWLASGAAHCSAR